MRMRAHLWTIIDPEEDYRWKYSVWMKTAKDYFEYQKWFLPTCYPQHKFYFEETYGYYTILYE